MITHPEIFKLDSEGRLRSWQIEQDAEKYRFVTGLAAGTKTRSEWTTAVPASCPTPLEQANFEVDAAYKHQLKREYSASVDAAMRGPSRLFPMLAKPYEGKVSFPAWTQPKLDGMRCIAEEQGLFSREGQPIISVPHIFEALAAFREAFPDARLDGELYNHDLADDLEEIMSLCRKKKPTAEQLEKTRVIQYWIYDYPTAEGNFLQRWNQLLRDLTPFLNPSLVLVETDVVSDQAELDDYNDGYADEGYEGQIVRLDGPYQEGKRSKYLLKRKETEDHEYPFVRFEAGTGNWAGAAKNAVCRLPDGREFGANTKVPRERAKALMNETFVELTVTHKGFTKAGIPRNARVKVYHEHKRDT